jgi:hypothetical protein
VVLVGSNVMENSNFSLAILSEVISWRGVFVDLVFLLLFDLSLEGRTCRDRLDLARFESLF